MNTRFTYHKAPQSKKPISRLLTLCLLLSAFSVKAQTYVGGPISSTPAAGTYYNNTAIQLNPGFSFTAAAGSSLQLSIINQVPDCTTVANNLGSSKNYILTVIPRIPGYVPGSSYTNCSIMQTVQYIDGIGRPVQTIQIEGSPSSRDVVQSTVYDEFSREAQKMLPYAVTGSAASDGSYKTTAIADQGTFYTTPPTGVSAVANPYAITNFEPSPLNRTVEQGAPGAAWQPVAGSTAGHTDKIIYTNNNAILPSADSVNSRFAVLYRISTINSDLSRTLVNNGNYLSGQLEVTVSKNENWTAGRGGTTETYTDKEGHIVLKRTFNYTGTTLQTLSTYYVYDDLGNLAFVLPPQANPDAGLSSASNQTTLNNLCYQYGYDYKNRMAFKQLPGKGKEQMVYNLIDQLIFSEDANESAYPEWAFIKYDALGREIMTGVEKQNNSTYSALQAYVDNALTNYPATYPQWETPTTGTGNVQGYTNTCFPSSANVVPLVVNYYDNYGFPSPPSTFSTPTGASVLIRGQLTATKTAVLNTMYNTTPDMLWTAHYYDDLGRSTVTYAQHYLGGTLSPYNYDLITNTYNFSNQPTTVTRKHYNTTTTGTTPLLTIANQYLYDHMGRKLKTWEQITNGSSAPTTRTLISQVEYNEIGQLWNKSLHSTDSVNYLQTITYTYNERGWLLNSSAPLFSMQLQYNTGTNKQYNGNIAYQNWSSAANTTANTYTYTYDPLDRLTGATSIDNNNETNINYDLNGNIMSLNRYAAGTIMDQLTYNYINGSGATNQLQTIADGSGNSTGINTGTSSYSYDANGNVTADQTRSTGAIALAYNILNLPQTISGAKSITYTYDATGQKLRRVSTGTGNTDYIAGIQYDATGSSVSTISFVQTEEGKAAPSGTSYNYEYYLGDQLGNTRVTFDAITGSARQVQQDDYYAFGMEITRSVTSPKNEYLYNKKELQEELGQLDYGARFYDPVIARWTTVDPLVEAGQESTTPYGYVFDDPVKLTDPDGRAPTDIIILGTNNSSVTIQTSLINTTINAGSLGIDFHGNHSINGERAVQTGIDIASVFDPTGATSVISAGISAKNGEWLDAGLGILGAIPIAGEFAKEEKVAKDVEVIEEAVTAVEKDSKALLKEGRSGRQDRLRELADDDKLGSADRGWLKQEKNEVASGKRENMRNPPGKDLAHDRGREAAKGYSYKNSKLKNKADHKLQHKFDNNGLKNKERPL